MTLGGVNNAEKSFMKLATEVLAIKLFIPDAPDNK
jgi:hypothetical protein